MPRKPMGVDGTGPMAAFRHSMDWQHEPWGNCMSAWFDVAAELYQRGAEVPAHWHYRPPQTRGDVRDMDSWFAREAERFASAELVEFGNLLERYSRLLTAAGKDY